MNTQTTEDRKRGGGRGTPKTCFFPVSCIRILAIAIIFAAKLSLTYVFSSMFLSFGKDVLGTWIFFMDTYGRE